LRSQVYKKKTEAAKKEYLKALAAYRASLVSKGAGEGEGMYGNYGNYSGGGPQYGGYTPQGTIPSPPMSSSAATPPTQQPPIGKKPAMMSNMSQAQQQQHQNMMQSPMGPVHMQHMQQQQQHNNYMQQVRIATRPPGKSQVRTVSGSSTAAHARLAPTTARRLATHATARQSAPHGLEFTPRFGGAPVGADFGGSTERGAGADETAQFMYTARVSQSGNNKSGVGGRVLQ
jgi:hypothetical protein